MLNHNFALLCSFLRLAYIKYFSFQTQLINLKQATNTAKRLMEVIDHNIPLKKIISSTLTIIPPDQLKFRDNEKWRYSVNGAGILGEI